MPLGLETASQNLRSTCGKLRSNGTRLTPGLWRKQPAGANLLVKTGIA